MLRRLWRFLVGGGAPAPAPSPANAEEPAAPVSAAGPVRGPAVVLKRGRHATVQVGLDFGTSASKVMYTRLDTAQRTVRLLHWGESAAGYPSYCVPSLAAVDGRGRLLLGHQAAAVLAREGWTGGLSRFKMLLAGEVDPRFSEPAHAARVEAYAKERLAPEVPWSPAGLTATYLGWLMDQIRTRVRAELGVDEVNCIFNTCLPIDQHESPVASHFERVMATAEWVANRQIDWATGAREALAEAGQHLPGARYDAAAPETRLFMVPEAVASAGAYVTSLRKRAGLHVFVDIGAGTTDLSIMNLHLRDRDAVRSFWYAARSVPAGTGRVEAVLGALLREARGKLGTREELDAEMREPAGTYRVLIRDELVAIRKQTYPGWVEAYGHLSQQSAWTTDKVQVFLAGGGAALPEATKVFEHGWMAAWGPYRVRPLPPPDQAGSWAGDVPFGRIAVAFGLSTPRPELGDYSMPAESPNHTPPRLPVRDIEGPNPYW